MKLYLVRHGQTDWNTGEVKAQGQTDIPLNSTGVAQAEALRDKIRGMEFDVCYVSPLSRARQTAEIITEGKYELIFDDLLMERYFGELEGTSPKTWNFDSFDRRVNYGEQGVEPVLTILERAEKFLERVRRENASDARVLVVAHGTLIKMLHFNILGYDDETDFRAFHAKNCEMYEYKI